MKHVLAPDTRLNELPQRPPVDNTASAPAGEPPLSYRPVTAVDIEGFSKLSLLEQIRAQSDLAKVLDLAAERTGLDRAAWDCQVGGDGELAVLPGGTDLVSMTARYPGELARALTEINTARSPGPRIRLRAVLHFGALAPGVFGAVGHTPILVADVLNSGALRRRLAENPESDLVLAVSEPLFTGVVTTRLGGLDPDRFELIRVANKDRKYPVYAYRALPERAG